MRKSNLRFLCLAAAATLIMGGCSGSTDSGETVAVQSVSMLAGLSAGIQNRYAGKVTLKQSLPGSQKSADYPYQAFKTSF